MLVNRWIIYTVMKNDVILSGIAIGYDNNLIYECSNPVVMEDFKSYLDSTELNLVDKVNLWYEIDNKIYFLTVEPEKFQICNDEWVVNSDEIEGFKFKHTDGENLLDEIEDQFKIHALSDHLHRE